MKIRYNPHARDELIKAAEYYESQEAGLGARFLDTIDNTILNTAAAPLSWPIGKHGTRKRILVSPFPYSIRYKVIHDELVIIAIAHQSRDEDYWKDRIN